MCAQTYDSNEAGHRGISLVLPCYNEQRQVYAMIAESDEAARSLGFNTKQTMFLVILPQAWRTILPPVGNEFIALLKDTSLVSILAVSDLLRRGREFSSETFMYFETYTMVALVYLVITLLLSNGVSIMEARLSHYVRH